MGAGMTRAKIILSRMARYARSWRGALIIMVFVVWAVVAVVLADSFATGLLLVIGLGVAAAASIALLSGDDDRIRRSLRMSEDAVAETSDAAWRGMAGTESDPPMVVPPSDGRHDITVILTVFNDARFVGDAIESLKTQTLGSWRCVVVDDASTDDTIEAVLRDTEGDPRFTLIANDENQGLAAARNVGVAEASSEFICFLDGDDFLYPDSLGARLRAMRGEGGRPWVAGVYCQWSNVPEQATLHDAVPDAGMRRKRVTWLNSLQDAPFIATAPLLRRDVFEAVGGFPDVRTAEDTLFWNGVLRQGFIFEAVNEVGVAYRAKQSSMYRATAVEHARLISGSLAENALPMERPEIGPYPFTQGCDSYVWNTTLARRLVMALASAVEAADVDGTRRVMDELKDQLEPYHLWELPLEHAVAAGAARVCRYLPDGEMETRKADVVAAVNQLLEPEAARLSGQAASAISLGGSLSIEPRQRHVSIPDRLVVPSELLAGPASDLITGKIALMPGAAYHVDETGPLAEELAAVGWETVVIVSDQAWPAVAEAQASYRTPVLATPDPGDWIRHLAGVVVMNDWGGQWHPIVEHANDLGVPTFGKVEGAQDFRDDDAHRVRGAYTWVGTVLAQGQNDVDALPNQRTSIVSNSRLEKIWLHPDRNVQNELAVVNLNFTFGVLDDARDYWIGSVDQAMKQVGMDYVVSLHPEERDRYEGRYPIATEPMRHLLTKATVLVSRFSTVPFEAMARGVPFVYHNPHGERMPTFQNPAGAFDVTASADELAQALERSRFEQETFRDRSAQFFLRQVAVDPARRSAQRAAEAIARTLRT